MKKQLLLIAVSAGLLAACSNDPKTETAKTDSPKTEAAWVPVDSAKAMQAWMDYATPGEMHKMLAGDAGTWTAQITHWPADGAPGETSTATAVTKMGMDGRYQFSEYTGNMMGMPFSGMATVAYDNFKKMFISTWIDNMGTGIMKMEGTWDAASKTINSTGKGVDPAAGREVTMRETLKIIDANNQVMEMFGPDPGTGKEYRTMEIKLSRKK